MSLLTLLRADAARQYYFRGIVKDRISLPEFISTCLSPRFFPILFFRLGCWFAKHHLRPLGKLFSLSNVIFFGLEIGLDSEIGPGLFFPHTVGTVLGAKRIGSNAVIYHNVTIGAKTPDMQNRGELRPEVGDDAFLGAGCKILGPISLGDRVSVGANSVVVDSIPSDSLVVGIPGRAHAKRS